MSFLSLLLISTLTFAQTNTKKQSDDYDQDEETLSCMTPMGEEPETPWAAFEKAIPVCKRVFFTLKPGTRLDLGEAKISQEFKTGRISFLGTVLNGTGQLPEATSAKEIKNLKVWLSVDRCDLRQTQLEDNKGKSVEDFKTARFMILTEPLSGFINADDFPGAKHSCKTK